MDINENSGVLFPRKQNDKLQIAKQGKVNIGGTEYPALMTITKVNGNQYFDLYLKCGAVFQTKQKNHEKSPDVYGFVTDCGVEYKLAGWSNVSSKGNKFMSLSIQENENQQNTNDYSEATEEAIDATGDIPF